MIGRIAAATAVLILLAGCASVESAGRNAQESAPQRPARSSPILPPPRTEMPASQPQTLPPPQSAPAQSALPPPVQSSEPPVAAANVQAPPPPRVTPPRDDEDVVVPGVIDRQIPPPNGDPRTASERMSDINAWDRCVTRLQASYEGDPTRPQLDSPEEACSRSLGMSSRDAVPDSRMQRRR